MGLVAPFTKPIARSSCCDRPAATCSACNLPLLDIASQGPCGKLCSGSRVLPKTSQIRTKLATGQAD
jgi:hypothetical protein